MQVITKKIHARIFDDERRCLYKLIVLNQAAGLDNYDQRLCSDLGTFLGSTVGTMFGTFAGGGMLGTFISMYFALSAAINGRTMPQHNHAGCERAGERSKAGARQTAFDKPHCPRPHWMIDDRPPSCCTDTGRRSRVPMQHKHGRILHSGVDARMGVA